jgi:DNA polymerase
MNPLVRETKLYDKIAELLKKQGFSDERVALELSDIYTQLKEESALDRETLEKMIPTCRTCYGMNLISEKGPVAGRGSQGEIDILFVGLMPGATEEQTGRVFSGPNSEVLLKGMVAAGIGSKDCPSYMHNLVCCTPLSKVPTVKQLNYCTLFLGELIWVLNPNIIVTLGAEALSFMMGKKVKLKDYEGEVLLLGRYIVVPITHPSYLHRNPDKAEFEVAAMKYNTTLQSIRTMNDRIKKLKADKQMPRLEDGDNDGVQQSMFEVCE